jgi:hypothetical protein
VSLVVTLAATATISFRPGDRPINVLTLGFRGSEFKSCKIGQLTGIQLGNQTLASFFLLRKQSVGDLVNAVPGLGNLPLREV